MRFHITDGLPLFYWVEEDSLIDVYVAQFFKDLGLGTAAAAIMSVIGQPLWK